MLNTAMKSMTNSLLLSLPIYMCDRGRHTYGMNHVSRARTTLIRCFPLTFTYTVSFHLDAQTSQKALLASVSLACPRKK